MILRMVEDARFESVVAVFSQGSIFDNDVCKPFQYGGFLWVVHVFRDEEERCLIVGSYSGEELAQESIESRWNSGN
jgi:hypothetical protein